MSFHIWHYFLPPWLGRRWRKDFGSSRSSLEKYQVGNIIKKNFILFSISVYGNIYFREDATASLFQVIGTSGKFDVSKLKDWAEKSKLDPNDPYNAAFFHFLEQAGDSVKVDPSYFRLDPLQRDFNFCEEADIDKNFRLKLLKLRDLGEPEFRGMKPVPLNEKQIHKDIFKVTLK